MPDIGFQNNAAPGLMNVPYQAFEDILGRSENMHRSVVQSPDAYLSRHQAVDCLGQFAAGKGILVVVELCGEIGQIGLDHGVGTGGTFAPQVQLPKQPVRYRPHSGDYIDDQQPGQCAADWSAQGDDSQRDRSRYQPVEPGPEPANNAVQVIHGGPVSEGLQAVVRFRQSGDLADRKSTRLNSSHVRISYAVCCL